MRNAFINHLTKKAETDERLFLIVGDLGFSVIEPFAERFPERYLNAGVAEQNMTSIAAGLAREGYRVFTYSIGNFTTLRCYEQIRNDVAYHNLDVCVVSVGGGYMYGSMGPSHHLTEDIAAMRVLPNMRVFVPFSPQSAERALDEVVAQSGPAYVRLGRAGLDVGPVEDNGFSLISSQSGAVEALLSIGKVSEETLAMAQNRGADAYALCRIKPFPEKEFEGLHSRYKKITVVEDHQKAGGVYSALSEHVSSLGSVSIPDSFSSHVTSEEGQRKAMMICDESVEKKS